MRQGSTAGQASFEAAWVFALLFLVLIPMIFVFQRYAAGLSQEIAAQQVVVIGNNIVASAETVYYLGEPSRLTLYETFPPGILNLTLLGANELVFTLAGSGEVVFLAPVGLQGSFGASAFSPGEKRISVEASGSAVNITIR